MNEITEVVKILRLPDTIDRLFVYGMCFDNIIRDMEILRVPWFIGILCVYEQLKSNILETL